MDSEPPTELPGAHDVPAEVRSALEQIARSAQAALGADGVVSFAVDPDTRLVSAFHTSVTEAARRAALAAAVGRGPETFPLWDALRAAGRLLVLPDLGDTMGSAPRTTVLEGAAAILGILLQHDSVRVDDRSPPLGAVFCCFNRPRRFTEVELDTARGVALLSSLALANAYLRASSMASLTRMRELEAQQAALRRVAMRIAQADGPEEDTPLHAAEEARRVLGADSAAVARFEGAAATLVETAGRWGGPGTLVPLTGDGILAQVARTGEPVLITDVAALPVDSPTRAMALKAGTRGVVAAPVLVDGRIWGALVAAVAAPRALPADGVQQLARFAELVALDISNSAHRARLVEQSTRDPLTGLVNSRAFGDRLDNEIERCRRRDRVCSLAVIDLDHFKGINDRFGHLVGDEVLVEFAHRLTAHARAEDTLARVGGEEFCWLMPECDAAAAHAAAERARIAVAGRPFPGAGRVTMSVGIATWEPSLDGRMLFAVADDAVYRAKAEGRNRTVVGAPAEEDGAQPPAHTS